MCMWFGFNPEVNFCHFSTLLTLSFFLHNFILIFMQLCTSFLHGLKMCMWFGFNPGVNFCHFSELLTLSFFAGGPSTSPKFNLYF